jgi:hypothetical protein
MCEALGLIPRTNKTKLQGSKFGRAVVSGETEMERGTKGYKELCLIHKQSDVYTEAIHMYNLPSDVFLLKII